MLMSKARLTLGHNSSWLEGTSVVVDLKGKLPLSNAELFKIYHILPYFFSELRLGPDIIIGLYPFLALSLAWNSPLCSFPRCKT